MTLQAFLVTRDNFNAITLTALAGRDVLPAEHLPPDGLWHFYHDHHSRLQHLLPGALACDADSALAQLRRIANAHVTGSIKSMLLGMAHETRGTA